MKDDELLDKLHKEPDVGMKLLMNQYAGLVYAVVKSKLTNTMFCAMDIENCVVEVFSEFYYDLNKYKPSFGSIKSWICVIAKNNAIDMVRKHYKDKGIISLDDNKAEQYADDFSIEGDFEDNELRKNLIKAICDLGSIDREIVVRKFYLAQSSKEIAEKLDMKVSNIDTRTHRALKKLRKAIGGEQL